MSLYFCRQVHSGDTWNGLQIFYTQKNKKPKLKLKLKLNKTKLKKQSQLLTWSEADGTPHQQNSHVDMMNDCELQCIKQLTNFPKSFQLS
jgi:hypothetical protein